MYRMIFRHRWAAVLFVLLVVAGALRLVGTQDQDGQLAEMQRQVSEQREQFEQATAADTNPFAEEIVEDDSEPEVGFAGDSDLIDPAEGTDPTPPEPEIAGGDGEPVELVSSGEEEL